MPDRGYFSEPNIKYMEQHGYDFLIMVKGCKDLVNKIILRERGKFEDEWEYTIPYYGVNGITTKGYVLPKDEKERWMRSAPIPEVHPAALHQGNTSGS